MKWLGVFRGLAILLVVISHAPYYGLQALADGGWWGYRAGVVAPTEHWAWVGNANYYALIGLNQLGLASVPIFLFASGFFAAYAARSNHNRISWAAVQGWLKSVVPPWGAWLVLSVVLYAVEVVAIRRPPEFAALIERRVLDYYYIPLLIQMLLLAPALAWLAFRRPYLLLALSALVEGTIAALHYVTYFGVPDTGVLGWANLWNWVVFWQWIFFYALGLVTFRYYDAWRKHLVPYQWALLGAAVTLGLASIVETATLHRFDGQYMDNLSWKASTALYALAVILTLVSWDWRRGRLVSTLERLGALSLGIYLVQPIVLDYATKVIGIARPQLLLNQGFLQPLLVVAGVGLPVLLMWLVARSPLRRYHYFLFGSHAAGPARPAVRKPSGVAPRAITREALS
jgi:surface polysaccharide O-acyltransferase-like enzyme